ncbi:alpha-amylase [Chiua virens]|nr:alpha-amylase [Chiua virens]
MFLAVWISPVSQNYQGPTTPYGDAYHGYWVADATKLNDRFGTSDDLKALSRDLHARGMYLMVDVVVNDVMATSTTPDLSTYMFKEQSQFHPYCVVDWSNATSEERCWLGDTVVPLADINTEDPTVVSAFQDWHQIPVSYTRLAAKHVNIDFWPGFCAAAGVFCIGEIYGSDVDGAAMFQGPNALDSVLNYPIYDALVNAFTIPGPQNMSALTDVIAQSQQKYKDLGLLGNFVENQDNPRWQNLSVDPQSLYNAMIFNFMSDGIPIVYYGQEQGFSGGSDPWNREPLWPSGYANTTTYQLITTLNQVMVTVCKNCSLLTPPQFRNFLVNHTSWVNSSMQVLTFSNDSIAFQKGDVVSVLTNVGSPPRNASIAVYTPYPAETPLMNILNCAQWPVGSNGTIDVEYTKGGVPIILVPIDKLKGTGLCGYNTLVSSSRHPSGAQALHVSFFGSQSVAVTFLLATSLFVVYFG